MHCFLCHGRQFATVYSSILWDILRCQNCGIFLKRLNKPQTVNLYDSQYYDDYPYSNFFKLNQNYFKNKVRTIKKYTSASNPYILDAGCGWGDFLNVVKGEKLPYLGIDLSPAAIAICKNKNLLTKKASFEDLLKEKMMFDAIVSFQTIEHIKDPILFLKMARQVLAPKGIILLTSPNNNSPLRYILREKWSVYNIDSHFTFFNKETLKMTLEKVGFINVKVRVDSPRFFSIGYILSRLRKMKYDIRNTIYEIPIPTDPLGDLEAVGFKP